MADPARPFLFVVALSVLVMTALYPVIAFARRGYGPPLIGGPGIGFSIGID